MIRFRPGESGALPATSRACPSSGNPQLGNDLPRDHAVYIHLTLLPFITGAGELKTKPAQHSVKELRSIGIQPDILLCRSDRPIPREARRKLGLFCNVRESAVIEALDVDNIYAVPEAYHASGLDREVLAAFGFEPAGEPDLDRWRLINERIRNPEGAGTHCGGGQIYRAQGCLQIADRGAFPRRDRQQGTVTFDWIELEVFEREDPAPFLEHVNGILVPGGFGQRGTEGKIRAAQFARERQVPDSGSASACRWRSSRPPATSAASRRRTRRSRRYLRAGGRADDGMDEG